MLTVNANFATLLARLFFYRKGIAMAIVIFGALMSVVCLALAGFLMYRNHVTFGWLSAAAALLCAGTLALRKIENTDERLFVLLPVVSALLALVWWVRSKRSIAMWSFISMLFVHSWFMKAVFMQYE